MIFQRAQFASAAFLFKLQQPFTKSFSTTSLRFKATKSKMTLSPNQRLTALREQFKDHGIGMYVVLTQDEHDSEYTSNADNRREYISGMFSHYYD